MEAVLSIQYISDSVLISQNHRMYMYIENIQIRRKLVISEDISSLCALPQSLFNTCLPDIYQPPNTKPHFSFDKWGLVFNYWLSLSSIFTASTLRIYPSFNAGVFGRVEPSAVYAGTSFFISPMLFLESIHYNHPNFKRVFRPSHIL